MIPHGSRVSERTFDIKGDAGNRSVRWRKPVQVGELAPLDAVSLDKRVDIGRLNPDEPAEPVSGQLPGVDQAVDSALLETEPLPCLLGTEPYGVDGLFHILTIRLGVHRGHGATGLSRRGIDRNPDLLQRQLGSDVARQLGVGAQQCGD